MLVTTQPGTEIKVTPESEAPIMPNATMNQGDLRFPIKKLLLSAFRDVSKLIPNKTKKYAIIIVKIKPGVMDLIEGFIEC